MKEFAEKDIKVKISGEEYQIKELSLAQKIKIIGGIAEFIRDIAKNAFFKKSDNGSLTFNFIDEISLAELNVDKIIMNTLDVLPELFFQFLISRIGTIYLSRRREKHSEKF